jgi:hypothetical protein
MSMRRISVALWSSVVVFGLLTASWFVLNHYRVLYYNDSIEGPSPQTSPYWTIIHAQDLLLWPILIAALCAVGLTLFKVAKWIGRTVAKQRMQ